MEKEPKVPVNRGLGGDVDPDARLQSALRLVSDGVWDWDLTTDQTVFSPESLAVWGFLSPDPPPTTEEIFARVHPEDLPGVREAIRAHLAGETPGYRREFQVVRPDGTTRWILGRGGILEWDEDRRPTRMIGTNVDITFEKEAASQLLLQTTQMKAAQEMARVGYWTYDPETQQPEWSEMMFQIFGLDPAQGVPNYPTHRKLVHPEDWERFDTAVGRALEGEPYDLRLRLVLPDGSEHVCRSIGMPQTDSSSKVSSLLGVTQDITSEMSYEKAIRDREELFRNTFEQAAVGMVQADLDSEWQRVNHRFSEMLGYQREDLEDLDFTAITHPDDREASVRHFQRITAGEIPLESWRKRYLRKDGSIMWGLLTGSLVRDAHGEPLYYLGIIEDISGQVIAENELVRSRASLRLLNARVEAAREEERVRFSREIHDNLSQGLIGVRMDLETIIRELENTAPEVASSLRTARDLLETQIQLTRDLAYELRSPMLDLLGLMEGIRAEVDQFRERGHLDWQLSLPEEEPELSEQAKTGLFHIFREAATNAILHANATTIQVSVSTDPTGTFLSVRDDGIGVSPGIQFQPTSMGLLGMSERARAMRGRLTVRAHPEGGTEVRVSLPTH